MKFRVHNEEHSKAIQEKLFSLGINWGTGGCHNTGAKYLIVGSNIGFSDNDLYFNGLGSHKETTLDDLFKMTSNKLKVSSLDHEVEITKEFVRVGCQKIQLDDAKEIARFLLEHIK